MKNIRKPQTRLHNKHRQHNSYDLLHDDDNGNDEQKKVSNTNNNE